MSDKDFMFVGKSGYTPPRTEQVLDKMKEDCQQLLETLTADMAFSAGKEEPAEHRTRLKNFQTEARKKLSKYIKDHGRILYSVVSAWVNHKALDEGYSFDPILKNIEQLYASLGDESKLAKEERVKAKQVYKGLEQKFANEKITQEVKFRIIDEILSSIKDVDADKGAEFKKAPAPYMVNATEENTGKKPVVIKVPKDMIEDFVAKLRSVKPESAEFIRKKLAQQKAVEESEFKKLEEELGAHKLIVEEKEKKVRELILEQKVAIKLYDHVNLAVQQVDYIKKYAQTSIEKFSIGMKEEGENRTKFFINTLKKSLENYEKKIRDSEKNYIAILGIFAAIVLAFTGSLIFSTSVFEHMHKVSVYRAVGMALIIGMVLINVLHFMFYCIERCMERKDFKTSFCVLAGVNMLFIALLVCNYGAWCRGQAEERNARITKAYPSSAQDRAKASSPPNLSSLVMEVEKEIVSIYDTETTKVPTYKDVD